jgi:hypothetical protein
VQCKTKGVYSMKIYIAPLPAAFLERARTQGLDDQGQPVQRMRSEHGGEPCRDVLRRARPGEEVILASYGPFTAPGPYKEFGPVFILATPSHEPVARDVLRRPRAPRKITSAGSSPCAPTITAKRSDAALVAAADAAATIERWLQSPGVAFVHARFPAWLPGLPYRARAVRRQRNISGRYEWLAGGNGVLVAVAVAGALVAVAVGGAPGVLVAVGVGVIAGISTLTTCPRLLSVPK